VVSPGSAGANRTESNEREWTTPAVMEHTCRATFYRRTGTVLTLRCQAGHHIDTWQIPIDLPPLASGIPYTRGSYDHRDGTPRPHR
jgi:hypothetical protein